jgi:hypothetical protein
MKCFYRFLQEENHCIFPLLLCKLYFPHFKTGSRRGRDRMVVGSVTTCAINAYHQYICEFKSRSWRGVQGYH